MFKRLKQYKDELEGDQDGNSKTRICHLKDLESASALSQYLLLELKELHWLVAQGMHGILWIGIQEPMFPPGMHKSP